MQFSVDNAAIKAATYKSDRGKLVRNRNHPFAAWFSSSRRKPLGHVFIALGPVFQPLEVTVGETGAGFLPLD